MKHPILCLFMICIFTFLTAQPFMNSSAGELWNSRSGANKPDSGYYNKRKSGKDGDITIYNRKKSRSNVYVAGGGLRSSMDAYKKMKMARSQKSSKLWDKMSPSALRNRQTDINLALQREYDTRKRTTAMMVKGAKQREAERFAGEKAHKAALDKFYAKREAEKAEREEMKQYALQGGYGRVSSGSKRSYKSIKKRNAGLKKPKKLFNDPNY